MWPVAKRCIIAVLSLFFLASLPLVVYHESGPTRVEAGPQPVVTGPNQACVDCPGVAARRW